MKNTRFRGNLYAPFACVLMAESEGFEPSERFPVHTISNRAPSTTQPTLHTYCFDEIIIPQLTFSVKCFFYTEPQFLNK